MRLRAVLSLDESWTERNIRELRSGELHPEEAGDDLLFGDIMFYRNNELVMAVRSVLVAEILCCLAHSVTVIESGFYSLWDHDMYQDCWLELRRLPDGRVEVLPDGRVETSGPYRAEGVLIGSVAEIRDALRETTEIAINYVVERYRGVCPLGVLRDYENLKAWRRRLTLPLRLVPFFDLRHTEEILGRIKCQEMTLEEAVPDLLVGDLTFYRKEAPLVRARSVRVVEFLNKLGTAFAEIESGRDRVHAKGTSRNWLVELTRISEDHVGIRCLGPGDLERTRGEAVLAATKREFKDALREAVGLTLSYSTSYNVRLHRYCPRPNALDEQESQLRRLRERLNGDADTSSEH